jgi:hypothetical protein
MSPLTRLLLILGVAFLILGGMFYLVERLGLHLGRLPGDIRIVRGNFTCVFPLATSILLSILLTVLLNLIARTLKK